VDNVAVSQNKSIRRDDEAGAVPADFALATSCLHALCYLDVNYRRCDTRNRSNHRPRICIEQIRVVRLHFATNKLCSASVGLIEKKIDRTSIIFRRSCDAHGLISGYETSSQLQMICDYTHYLGCYLPACTC